MSGCYFIGVLNRLICVAKNAIVQVDFEGYSADLADRVWSYAKQSGIKEFELCKRRGMCDEEYF